LITSINDLRDRIPDLQNLVGLLEAPIDPTHPRLAYIRFRENEPQDKQFAMLLGELLTSYAIPLQRRVNAGSTVADSSTGGDLRAAIRLHKEAVKLFLDYNAANPARFGEVGEVIAFAIASEFLEAPQIASKMTLKTNSQMPLHGTDGLHVRLATDGSMFFYLMESKLAPDANTGIKAFCESAKKFRDDPDAKVNEIRIVTNLSNLDALTGPARAEALAYFDGYDSSKGLMRRDRHVGALTYTEKAYTKSIPIDDKAPASAHEDHFRSLYAAEQVAHNVRLEKHAKEFGLPLGEYVVFTLAVPDMLKIKEYFAEELGGNIR
jgi:hypothetical protein